MALDYLRRYAQPHVVPVEPDFPPGFDLDSSDAGLDEVFAGRLLPHASGECFITETIHDPDHYHGRHPLTDLISVSPRSLSILTRDPDLAHTDLRQAVFLDTETTGLGMGVGTYVFLVGAGYLEEGCFHVRQFFLRSPGDEISFLMALDQFLRRFKAIISFNGKAFDWPLLEYRFVGSRELRVAPFEDPPHIDLLHPARRLWKRRLESCKLTSLERSILGVERTEEDVPGWLIPSLYFQYIRTGNARPLASVFYHNLQDILSLASLTVHLDRVLSDPRGGLVDSAADFICLARQFELIGDIDMAITCLEEALDRRPVGRDLHEALIRLSLIHKRDRRWEPALRIWDQLVDEGGRVALYGLVERAKYYEHIERDYLEALDDTQRALNQVSLRHEARYERYRRDLERRENRLINQVYRERSWARR